MSEGLWREWYDPLRKQNPDATGFNVYGVTGGSEPIFLGYVPAFLQPIPIEWTDFDRALAQRLGILLD